MVVVTSKSSCVTTITVNRCLVKFMRVNLSCFPRTHTNQQIRITYVHIYTYAHIYTEIFTGRTRHNFHELRDRRLYGWTYGCVGRLFGLVGLMNGLLFGLNYGWIEGWMDEWMDGWMDGWREGGREGGREGLVDRLIERTMSGWPGGWLIKGSNYNSEWTSITIFVTMEGGGIDNNRKLTSEIMLFHNIPPPTWRALGDIVPEVTERDALLVERAPICRWLATRAAVLDIRTGWQGARMIPVSIRAKQSGREAPEEALSLAKAKTVFIIE